MTNYEAKIIIKIPKKNKSPQNNNIQYLYIQTMKHEPQSFQINGRNI